MKLLDVLKNTTRTKNEEGGLNTLTDKLMIRLVTL
jgi:hypothetical protein